MTSMLDNLSVVILNYRTPGDTAQAVQSIMSGARPDAAVPEVIVVDNGSNDDSLRLIAEECPCAKIIELGENRGFAAGMNAGMAGSRGEYILLLNSDVRVEPGSLEALLTHMGGNNLVGLAAPLLLDDGGRPMRSLLVQPTIWRTFIPLLSKLQYARWKRRIGDQPVCVEATEGAAVIVSRKALADVGLMDEQFFFYYEIVDWCMRFRSKGYSVQVLPAARMRHACGTSVKTLWEASRVEIKRSEYQILCKHLGRTVAALAVWRDVLVGLLRTVLYSAALACTVGRNHRIRAKLASYYGLVTWLFAGRPDRNDERYISLFGRWDR